MGNLATNSTPSLFPPELPPPPSQAVEETEPLEPKPQKLAQEFVRWCCSLGSDFRNSPDITNLRYWLHKNRIKGRDIDEDVLLLEARRLFSERVQQSLST